MRSAVVVILAIAIAFVPASASWGQSAQQIGRYQVVTVPGGFPLLVDTTTGRVWMWAPSNVKGVDSGCRGLEMCFYELDRVKWTDAGWVSEIYPSKR